jgi:transposase
MKSQGYLGIDVSKGYADFLLLDENKHVVEQTFQLHDDVDGRKQLRKIIDTWFQSGLQTLNCGVESTGGYENNWYNFLRGLSLVFNVKVARLNAKAVKAVSDAALKRTITDAVSAENIAVYLIGFPDKIKYNHTDSQADSVFKEGRQHFTYIRMLVKQKVQLNNQLEKLLYQYFPEILVYCRRGIPGWLLRMLTRYSSATAVVKAGESKLADIKGISSAKAKALVAKASKSDQLVSKHIQHVIAATCKELIHKEGLIEDEKEYLTGLFEEDEKVKLLTTIPCIGKETAVLLMLEIEDIGRFETAKKLAAYFGVHPTYKQSGDGIWQVGMSKKGRGEVRAALYMAAFSGIRCNALLKNLYARFRGNGMKHYQALGVVMHKLLRMIFGILKTNTPFDAAIDEKNTQQSEEKQKQKEEKLKEAKKVKNQNKYRFQAATTEAPISRIAAQKIKQIASQAS